MIQRIQSIWLFLAGLALVALIFTPLAGNADNYHVMVGGLYQDVASQCTKIAPSLPLLIFDIALALLSFINIFNFKNRSLQKRFAFINIIFFIGLEVLLFIAAKKIPGGLENAQLQLGFTLPVIAIIFSLLAINGINKDEKLIRSADRLR